MSKNEWIAVCVAAALAGVAVGMEWQRRKLASTTQDANPLAWLNQWST